VGAKVSKSQPLVLIVDDEIAILEMTRYALEQSGMKILTAENAHQAILQISENRPDIILMDWMMPSVSGIELTRRLRKDTQTRDIPIIMLTARITEDDKITGLDAGADDYLIKPFSPRELMARIRAVLRRSRMEDEEGLLKAGKLTMDIPSRRVHSGNKEVKLGPTDFRLLEYFMAHPGRVYSRTQLLDQVWGTNVYLEERSVDVHIRRLRKALETVDLSEYLQTVRGHGYRFLATEQE
jgi:two-component system phosphate regulon response regulator PhoB